MKEIKKKIEENLKKAVKEITKKDVEVVVFPASKKEFGDFTTNISFLCTFLASCIKLALYGIINGI